MQNLLDTLSEVEPDYEKRMTLYALITARFYVVEKDGRTSDNLPILVQVTVGGEKIAVQVSDSTTEVKP